MPAASSGEAEIVVWWVFLLSWALASFIIILFEVWWRGAWVISFSSIFVSILLLLLNGVLVSLARTMRGAVIAVLTSSLAVFLINIVFINMGGVTIRREGLTSWLDDSPSFLGLLQLIYDLAPVCFVHGVAALS